MADLDTAAIRKRFAPFKEVLSLCDALDAANAELERLRANFHGMAVRGDELVVRSEKAESIAAEQRDWLRKKAEKALEELRGIPMRLRSPATQILLVALVEDEIPKTCS